MRLSKSILYLIFPVLFSACVEPFEPRVGEEQKLMVIDGILNDRDSVQTVTVSLSSPYNEPDFVPVTGCVVRVEDHLGEGLTYLEVEPGIYRASPENGFAAAGKVYRLMVFTPDGLSYESDFDTLLSCPPIEKLDYDIEEQGTSDPSKTYYGIRFYLDLTGSSQQARSFMWKYEETWEYRAYYPIHYMWDGDSLYDYTPELEGYKTCYLTSRLKEYQVGTTALLKGNEIRRQPIHFVSNQSPRLQEKYSLLVLQHSLSDAAYDYLERLRSQSGNTGGLFENQPTSTRGNIYNTQDPEERVLGFFMASQVTKKRIMVDEALDITIPNFYCPLDTAWVTEDFGLEVPYYMYSATVDGTGPPYVYSYPACHNCLYRGGTNVKPEYWEEGE
jgi:hypothetical protein